jgi:hypothetical protein
MGSDRRRAGGRRNTRSMGRRSYPSARLPVHARLTFSRALFFRPAKLPACLPLARTHASNRIRGTAAEPRSRCLPDNPRSALTWLPPPTRSRRPRYNHPVRDDNRVALEHVPLLRARRVLARRRMAREQGAEAGVGRLPRGDAAARMEDRARAGPWDVLPRAEAMNHVCTRPSHEQFGRGWPLARRPKASSSRKERGPLTTSSHRPRHAPGGWS